MPSTCVEPDAAMWSALQESRSSAAREAIFLHYLPYARTVATNIYAGRWSKEVAVEDYHQLACVGLLEAMMQFEPTYGVSFKTFCTPRITGSVLDGIRRLTDTQEQISLRRRSQQDRLASLKQVDSAARPLIRLADVTIGLAIGHMLEGTGMYLTGREAHLHDGYEAVAWTQTCRSLREAVERLPQDMAKVIGFHYFHGVPFEQVANVMGLSKGRISQIHRAGLIRLRDAIRTQHESWR